MRPINFIQTATFRVAALQALLFAIVVAALFGLVWREIHTYVADQLRTAVEVETASLREAARVGELESQIRQRVNVLPVGPDYVLLSDANGQRIAGNLLYRPTEPGWQRVPFHGAHGRHKGHAHQVDLYVTPLGDGRWLTVGRDNRDIGELDENLARYFYFSVGFAMLFALLSGGIAGHFFIKNVDRLSSWAERIVTGEAPGPLRPQRGGVEFARLAGRLNRILERVHTLMENMRQVSNDIAHDLRTPLTRLRQRLESATTAEQDAATQRIAIEQSIHEVDNVLATFGALLRISRIQARERQAGFASVDLSELFVSMAEVYGPVAEETGHAVNASVQPGVAFKGDRALLTQMLSNLIENAIHHTPAGTCITVSLNGSESGAVGCVADDGPGIPVHEHKRVFDRFVRLDSSRTSPGSGLGLALVAAIADLHRVPLALSDRQPGLAVQMQFA
ncbi:sensor histidine kinase [Dyella caseinilytica]|uniref:histidine kinase n=1 Tax=Dyella caseinilytica TaxID=1849581 RepID=A0ABX7GT69_9GAMM|nr:HAMP domain-containing sensor histidine kinase [Dyella caseinilytica]QRN53648.1 HAMP domain-containing histidine kinase [Dyella caseinilytica]GFZ88195.1 two-component sensor histidine kinase [Dyella caseinilytica]